MCVLSAMPHIPDHLYFFYVRVSVAFFFLQVATSIFHSTITFHVKHDMNQTSHYNILYKLIFYSIDTKIFSNLPSTKN
jgi:hypothetical protein